MYRHLHLFKFNQLHLLINKLGSFFFFFNSLSTVKNRIVCLCQRIPVWEIGRPGKLSSWERFNCPLWRFTHDQMSFCLKMKMLSFFCFTLHAFTSQPHNWIWRADWSWIGPAFLHGSDQSRRFCYSSAEKWISLLQLRLGKRWHQHHDPRQNQWRPVASGKSPYDVGSALEDECLVAVACMPLMPVLHCQCRHWPGAIGMWPTPKIERVPYATANLGNVIRPG